MWNDKPRTSEQRRRSEMKRAMEIPAVRRVIRANQAETMRALSAPRAYPSDSWSGDHHNNLPAGRNAAWGLFSLSAFSALVILLCSKLAMAQNVAAAYVAGGFWSATGMVFSVSTGTILCLAIPAGLYLIGRSMWKSNAPARRGWSD